MQQESIFLSNFPTQIAIDKGRSHTETNEGMRPLIMGRSPAVLAATILFSMLAFNLLKKKKKRASTPSFISTTPTGEGNDHYDVFLSFRGSDTRKGFADHLYHSLDKAGIVPVFRDDKSIPIGEEFGPRILDAIARSKISIPIISKNYASSKWCLRELIHIMDHVKSTSHIVFPIFYKVNSSDERHLKGSFGKAFHSRKKYFDEEDIQKGQQALKEVSYLHGWESENVANGFLADIRETARHNNIAYLQKQLIKDILQIEPSNVDEGISRIKSGFKGKKVLILLDDIDHKDQLNALARECNWFMAGSIIIVTTRYEAILDQSEFKVDKYDLNELDQEHALLLFNKHAFCMEYSPRHFEGLSSDIVSTMVGLPLAVEVVGSYLYKKPNRKVWEDVQKQLKSQPHRDVQKILQISYDALEDGHKQIFLDIVCFFIGVYYTDIEYAMYMWEDCGFYPSQGIEELKLRCLIKIGDDGSIKMHDQLRDLGRSIFCQGQPLEKCSGPWDDDYKGVPKVLRTYEERRPLVENLQLQRYFSFHDFFGATSTRRVEQLSEVRWLQCEVWGKECISFDDQFASAELIGVAVI